ncbi:MAG TPA: hypothetical protein VHD84_02315 [Candidatus Saccharimonadales bacterium]|nr:hypothetical protein [Candidatus Saccharimonadales bacterium]
MSAEAKVKFSELHPNPSGRIEVVTPVRPPEGLFFVLEGLTMAGNLLRGEAPAPVELPASDIMPYLPQSGRGEDSLPKPL